MNKKIKGAILTAILILSIPALGLAYSSIATAIDQLKTNIISYITVDTSTIDTEYQNLGLRLKDYIRQLKTDAQNEITTYYNARIQEEKNKVKDKETADKLNLDRAKNEAVSQAKLNIDNQINNNVSAYDDAMYNSITQ